MIHKVKSPFSGGTAFEHNGCKATVVAFVSGLLCQLQLLGVEDAASKRRKRSSEVAAGATKRRANRPRRMDRQVAKLYVVVNQKRRVGVAASALR